MNTLITLKYVDGDNYKQHLDFVLAGEISDSQLQDIANKLDDGECIIADQIGLPTPSASFAGRFDFPTDSDHAWTTIEEFQSGVPSASELYTDNKPTIEGYTVDNFVNNILAIHEWDESSEMSRLGM
jgi:hypothetical protein